MPKEQLYEHSKSSLSNSSPISSFVLADSQFDTFFPALSALKIWQELRFALSCVVGTALIVM
jgi:hypothetical protein